MFLDMRLNWQEILIDEVRDFVVCVGFGFQPNARASSGSRAEIKQQGHLRCRCLAECRINIFLPFKSHF